jgi:hypothetical protein
MHGNAFHVCHHQLAPAWPTAATMRRTLPRSPMPGQSGGLWLSVLRIEPDFCRLGNAYIWVFARLPGLVQV